MNSRCATSLVMIVLCSVATASAQKDSFDVASIRINKSGGANSSISIEGSSLIATNVTLHTLLVYAYRPSQGFLQKSQIVGAPQWADDTHFDLHAKQDGAGPLEGGERTVSKLRALLEERFQLKIHRDVRTLPVYALTGTRKGPQWADDQTPVPPGLAAVKMVPPGTEIGSVPRGQFVTALGATTTSVMGNAIPIGVLLQFLQSQSERLIIDRSGIEKLIDVHLEFSRDNGSSLSGDVPSVFAALRQAGLELKAEKQAVEVLVVDNVVLPSDNY